MNLLQHLLTTIARGGDPGPFALLHRDGRGDLEVFAGPATTAARLADIPLSPAGPGRSAALGPRTIALIPYRQIGERGFACVDDGAPLSCVRVERHERVPLAAALADLADERCLADPARVPAHEAPITVTGGAFDVPDEEYAEIVSAVLRDEIGRGEGANFVIHRAYTATVEDPPLAAALRALRRLLVNERGAYWTFLVHTGSPGELAVPRMGSRGELAGPRMGARTLIGASPERHVSVDAGLVMKNPISGTHRHGPDGLDVAELLRFLADPKETDELYMVLDEELKMMATVAEEGGRVIGPYLKEMSHLTHTEYLLAGYGSRDVRDVLRETMFAPTVTGSPIENACRVIARYERRGRGYYAGAVALLGFDEAGGQSLDSAILIRTAEIDAAGRLRVPVGATLVRHSTTAGEVAETHVKAAGILAALGLGPAADAPHGAAARVVNDPRVRAALAARNRYLAPFWMEKRAAGAAHVPGLVGRTALIVDAEDTFTAMLAHQLRALGLAVTVRPYPMVDEAEAAGHDLVVAGPGPGDPTAADDPRMAAMRGVVAGALRRRQPLLAVCLSHQLLAGLLGLRLHRRDAPYQGLQRHIDLFGRMSRVGFYATFTALSDVDTLDTGYGRVELCRDAADGAVHALRGPGFAGVQFHAESVLSEDGLEVLASLLSALLPAQVA